MIDMHADNPLELIDKLIAQHLPAIMARAAEMQKTAKTDAAPVKQFFTIPELAERWRISRPTVYDWLREYGVKVFGARNGRGRKLIPLSEVLKLEARELKRFV